MNKLMNPKPQSPTSTSSPLTQSPPSVEGLPPQLTITTIELQSKLDKLNPTEQAKLIRWYKETIESLSDKDKIKFYDNGGMALLNILTTVAKALPKKDDDTPTTSPKFLQNLKQSGYLDESYGPEGLLSLTIPLELKQKLSKHDTAIQAYEEADNSSPSWIWDELKTHDMPLTPLPNNLDIITLNFNNNEEIKNMFYNIVLQHCFITFVLTCSI